MLNHVDYAIAALSPIEVVYDYINFAIEALKSGMHLQKLLITSISFISCIKERTPSSAAHGSYQMNSQTATYPVVSIQSKLSTVVLLR